MKDNWGFCLTLHTKLPNASVLLVHTADIHSHQTLKNTRQQSTTQFMPLHSRETPSFGSTGWYKKFPSDLSKTYLMLNTLMFYCCPRLILLLNLDFMPLAICLVQHFKYITHFQPYKKPLQNQTKGFAPGKPLLCAEGRHIGTGVLLPDSQQCGTWVTSGIKNIIKFKGLQRNRMLLKRRGDWLELAAASGKQ